ncbi:MAG: S53 family peptidase [Acidimicrobiales bacterium]
MRRIGFTLVAVLALCAGTLALSNPASAQAGRAAIAGSKPSWASPAARVADAGPADTVQFRVYLALSDHAGAEATARAVSDPSSPSYHQYLSADQVRTRFAPSAASVASVKKWLKGSGITPGAVPANRLYVEATASVAQVEKLFAVDLAIYSVRGQDVRGFDRDLTIPADLASTVTGVIGADQALALMRPDHIVPNELATGASPSSGGSATQKHGGPTSVPPADGFRNGRPCSAFFGEQVDTTDPKYKNFPNPLPYAPCGYTPPQLRSAYGTQTLLDQGLDGSSATVAIIDAFASPTIFADASEYADRNDPGHPLTHAQFSQVVFPVNPDLEGPDQCDAAGWYGEETLDVEAVHAMAPGAHIVYVGGSDCLDVSLDKALNKVISEQLAQIVSNSYGDLGEDVPADEVAAFQDIAIQGVVQGIGVYFSSGDSGDEVINLGTPSADFSASSPWVTAVGGTTLGIGELGSRQFETGWETGKSTLKGSRWAPRSPGGYVYGSGGGTSTLFTQPFYQRGVVPDALATQNQAPGVKGRVVPDISMLGDPTTGMLVGQTQTFPEGVHYDEYRIGGTSLSSPLFAGVVALSDDLLGYHHGFINPRIYKTLNGTPGITDVQHVVGAAVRIDFLNGVDDADGTVTSVRTFDFQGLTIKTTPGYDNVTGLGVPNGMQFLFRL